MRGSRRVGVSGAALLALAFVAQPARAEVIASNPDGFVVRLVSEVSATPAEAWKTMTNPAQWWSSQHTFSGDSANLTFEPVVGGCFCETLPRPEGAQASQKAGGVQHMRVIYIEPPRAMRLVGALGPLQSEALSATMTMTIKPTDKGSRILFEYVVGGYMRYKVEEIAPAVNSMLAAQLTSLAAKLGPLGDAPAPKPKPKVEGQMGPPAGDGGSGDNESAPTSSIAAPVGPPMSGAEDYRLPPAPARGAVTTRAEPAARLPVKPVVEAKPAPALKTEAKAVTVQPPKKPAVKPAARLAVKPVGKSVSKPAAKAPNPDDEARRDATAAFDAALGTSPVQ